MQGPIGRRGPNTTEEELRKPLHITAIPSAISLTIGTPNREAYDAVGELLRYWDHPENEIKISTPSRPRLVRTKRGVKPDEEKNVQEIETKNRYL